MEDTNKTTNRKRLLKTVLWFTLTLVILLIVLAWRSIRQIQLDRTLVQAIVSNQDKLAMQVLAEGADATILSNNKAERLSWIDLLHVLSGRRIAPPQGKPLLILAMESRLVDRDQLGPLTPDRIAMLKMLVIRGASVNVRGQMGVTPLEFAIENDLYDLFVCMLAHKANVNLLSFANVPLIDRAILYPDPRFVPLIVDHGADLNVRDYFGERPLDWARTHGNETCEQLLLAHHAKAGNDP